MKRRIDSNEDSGNVEDASKMKELNKRCKKENEEEDKKPEEVGGGRRELREGEELGGGDVEGEGLADKA